MSISIIGGGIGGLTTVIALHKHAIPSLVYEQAPQLKVVGAGIMLAQNAMQIYQKLGLRKEIENKGHIIEFLHITRSDLKPLSTVDTRIFEQKYGVRTIAVHRGELQKILSSEVPEESFKLGYCLEGIERNTQGFSLAFKQCERLHTDLLLGADGTHSKVREQLFPKVMIRKAQQICARGVMNDFRLPVKYQNELNEAWGKVKKVVNTSWRVGKIAHFSHPFLMKLRNLLMKLTPAAIHRKPSEEILKLNAF